ncbi:MAG: HD domain-containing protein [Phycisphaerales bacterium]
MNKKQLEELKKWFFDYVSGYYGNNPQVNDDIKLKEDHTKRMCADTPTITKELGFNLEQSLLAEAVSLLHDTGRFEQYRKYGTYNDVGTENHSLIGLKVLEEKKVLDFLESSDKKIIESAIRFHGVKDLPKNLDKDVEPFAKLIRDIDKLDIFYVMLSRVDELRADPEKCFAIFGYPANDLCSPHILQAVLKGRTISYSEFKSLNDMILGLLGWIYDINYTATLKEIKKRGLMEKLISYLPKTEETQNVGKHILDLLDKRIARNK